MKIFIAASGSGGHLFPALHIARAVKEMAPETEIHFVGAGRPLEEQLIAPHYPLHVISAARVMQQGIKGLINFGLTFPRAVLQLRQLFREHEPSVVVGVGGYASVIPILYSRFCRIPTLIHEAEKRPGLANRLLAPFSNVVSVARDECKIPGTRERIFAGQPMRDGLTTVRLANDTPRTLLVMGGSQGAGALDKVSPALARFAAARKLFVIHQTRKDNVEMVKATYRAESIECEVISFISDMRSTYDRADLIISRAGASTVSELEVVGRPVIFVPYPHAQADHQTENASLLVSQKTAVICAEGEQFEERLVSCLNNLLENDMRGYRAMRKKPSSTHNERAAGVIAQKILELASSRS